MAEVVKGTKPVHSCYDELYSFQWGTNQPTGYGSVVACSCGRRYRYATGNIFTSVWDTLNGRGHITTGRDIWDRWVEVQK